MIVILVNQDTRTDPMRVIKLEEFIANPDCRDIFYMRDTGIMYIDKFHKVFDEVIGRSIICIDFIMYNKGKFDQFVSYNEPLIYNQMKIHISDITLYKSLIIAIFRSSHEDYEPISPSELMDKFPEYFV